ncbi:hypothetical protein ACFZC5_26275 [Nocardia gamkensis]
MTGRYGTIARRVRWTVTALKWPRDGVTYHRVVISTDMGPHR